MPPGKKIKELSFPMRAIYVSAPDQKGFTLMEVVLSILLLGIISGVIAMTLMEGIGGWAAVSPRKEAMSGLRPAVERMVREIREGRRYNYSIPASDTLNFSIYTSIADPGRDISYSCAAGQRIDRTEGGTPNTLVDNISFCSFSTLSPNLISVLARSTVSGSTLELRDVAFMRNYTGQP